MLETGSPRDVGTIAGAEDPSGRARTDVSTLAQATDNAAEMRRYPVAYVTLHLPPAGRRTRPWAAYRCPHCCATHLARLAAEADAAGVRRAGCGRMVWLIVDNDREVVRA